MPWRFLCFACVAALAGCSHGNVGSAPATVTVVVAEARTGTTAMKVAAPAPAPPCRSNDDCGANTGGLCVPKPVTKELSDAEDFLEKAMTLDDLITRLGDTSSSAPIPTILQQLHEDLVMYSEISQGNVPAGANAAGIRGVVGQGTPLTNDQMQDAAWMQSGATQADMIIRQFLFGLSKSPITTDAPKVRADITGDSTGLHLDEVTDDLQTFLHDVEAVAAPVKKLVDLREPDGSLPPTRSGAGALILYLGPTITTVNDATSRVNAFLEPSAISQLKNELIVVSQGHDIVGKGGTPGRCLASP